MITFKKKFKLKLAAVALLAGMSLAFVGCSSDDGGDDSTDIKDPKPPAPTTGYTFEADVLPLFTTAGSFFTDSPACTTCHFDNSTSSAHELDLSSYDGIMTGADNDGTSVLGQTGGCMDDITSEGCVPDWDASKMKARLRNNRMPPGWPEGSPRDTPASNLIGEWVSAGAENASFDVTYTFEDDVLPLFTTAGSFFADSPACTTCHFDNTTSSAHELDLSSYAGIMTGADNDGTSVLGQTGGCMDDITSAGCVPDWAASKMRSRFRDNRMPPGWPDGSPRDTDGSDMLADWVTAGAPDGTFDCGADATGDASCSFDADVLPLFTTASSFFTDSPACTTCHFDNTTASAHELDLSSYAGVMTGADNDGTSVLGQAGGCMDDVTTAGCEPDWDASKMKARLRNNRMPPGWPAGSPRDTPASNLIGEWVSAGAENGSFTVTYTFEDNVLPLFTTAGSFFADSPACTTCHFDNTTASAHELDLSSYDGIMTGADNDGTSVLGQAGGCMDDITSAGCVPDWAASKMRSRFRDNRMPPGWPSGSPRDTDGSDMLACWVAAGATDGAFDKCE